MYLQVKDLVDRINVGNITAYGVLLVFSILLSLRVEGLITWSYGAVFFPLWVWNVLVAVGAVAGIIAWVRKRRLRQDPEHGYHFKALILSALLQQPVFLTELLVAVNLDTREHQWRAIFTPLYLLPLLYLFPCIWGCFRKRSLDLEVLGMCNLLQVIFLGIRLDRVVEWRWAVVFIPSYLLLAAYCLLVVACACYLALLHRLRLDSSPQDLRARRVADGIKVVSAVGVAVGITLFLALLISRLDGHLSAPYPAVFVPLYLTLLFLLLSTVARQPANPWWFGLHKNFSDFALDICPILREYVNISVHPEEPSSPGRTDRSMQGKAKHKHSRSHEPHIPASLYPHEDIYCPD